MIHASRIDRLVRGERFETLLGEVLDNGRPLPLAARAMLLDSTNVRTCAIALALQRTIELSYSPTPLAVNLGQTLLRLMQPAPLAGETAGEHEVSGSHVPHGIEDSAAAEPDAAAPGSSLVRATIALAALHDLLEQAAAGGVALPSGFEAGVERVRERVAHDLWRVGESLAARQPARRGLVGSMLESCLIVWQLMPRDGLATAMGCAANLVAAERALTRAEAWKNRDCAAVLALAGRVPMAITRGHSVAA